MPLKTHDQQMLEARATLPGASERPPFRGRGATINIEGRFETAQREAFFDDWFVEPGDSDGAERQIRTHVAKETAKSIISRNASPDLPFTYSINPYRGCEHGCAYCYARPTHGYLGLSPGLDFETRIFAKTNAATLLRRELAQIGYVPKVINIGANTDGYQPVERKLAITRQLIETLKAARHPLAIITKNALVLRDIDLLAPMAAEGLAHVTLSVTTLDARMAATLEPRASAPSRRIAAIKALAQAGIPTAINVAPIIPFLTDHEMERLLEAGAEAGAVTAGYTMLRLPWEVKDIFRAWLTQHFPDKAEHVMARQQEMRGGRDNDPNFGTRMHAQGVIAEVIRQRFTKAAARLGLQPEGHWAMQSLRTDLFLPPRGRQAELF